MDRSAKRDPVRYTVDWSSFPRAAQPLGVVRDDREVRTRRSIIKESYKRAVPERMLRQVKRYYLCVDASPRLVSKMFAEDCVYVRGSSPPLRGRAEVADFYAFDRMILSGTHELSQVLVSGPEVLVVGQFQGISRTRAPLDLPFGDIFRFDFERCNYRFIYRRTFFGAIEV